MGESFLARYFLGNIRNKLKFLSCPHSWNLCKFLCIQCIIVGIYKEEPIARVQDIRGYYRQMLSWKEKGESSKKQLSNFGPRIRFRQGLLLGTGS